MARSCDICGKGNQHGHNVSHANNKTNKVWSANLKRVKANVKGTIMHVRACTRCIRSGSVTKAA